MKNNSSEYFLQSKKVLLMFRRVFDREANQLELRHQRTADVVFEISHPNKIYENDVKLKEYIYQMIETLLPKAKADLVEGQSP